MGAGALLLGSLALSVGAAVSPCERDWALYPPNTDPLAANDDGFFIHLAHDVFDTAKGFVPVQTYQLSLDSVDGGVFQRFQLTALLARDPTQFAGHFVHIGSDMEGVSCSAKQGNGTEQPTEARVHIVSSTVDRAEGTPAVRLRWAAPDHVQEDGPACVVLVAKMWRGGVELHAEEEVCERRGCFWAEEGEEGEASGRVGDGGLCLGLLSAPSANQSLMAQLVSFDAARRGGGAAGGCLTGNLSVGWGSEADFRPLLSVCPHSSAVELTKAVQSEGRHLLVRHWAGRGASSSFALRYFAAEDSAREAGCNASLSVGRHGQPREGIFASPGYPAPYPPSTHCFYEMSAPAGHRLTLRFTHLHLEELPGLSENLESSCEGSDWIRLEQGFDEDPPHPLVWCGVLGRETLAKAGDLHSAASFVRLHFRSNEKGRGQGFQLRWWVREGCEDAVLEGSEGTLASPGFPLPYPNAQECHYHIRVPEGNIIQLTFSHLHLSPLNEFTEECLGDWVGVGRQRRCGSWLGKEDLLHFYSSDNSLNVSFASDASRTGPGFKAVWRGVAPNVSADCPSSLWRQGDLCVQVVAGPALGWFDALDDCRKRGGALAIAADPDADAFLDDVLRKEARDDQAFWIGATDLQFEADFTWVDGTRVNHSRWFPGWTEFQGYNAQPNDDGLAAQDCVELRRSFAFPSKGQGLADRFYWNDRHCAAHNGYVCQFLRPGAEAGLPPASLNCNGSVELSDIAWHVTLKSPAFPAHYPDFLDCFITIRLPPDSTAVLDFTKFILEAGGPADCPYDFLRVSQVPLGQANASSPETERLYARDLCGDWSRKLKLLRRVIDSSSELVFHLHSDHSRGFPGFVANVYLEEPTRRLNPCNNPKMHLFRASCYMFISYPQTSASTAQEICASSEAGLAAITDEEEAAHVVDGIVRSQGYTSEDRFWLGARRAGQDGTSRLWAWQDGFPWNFTAWFRGSVESGVAAEPWEAGQRAESQRRDCLLLQQDFRQGPADGEVQVHSFWTAERPYWAAADCASTAGYVCEKPRPLAAEGDSMNFSSSAPRGNISIPNFPSNYPNLFRYQMRIDAPETARILITFLMMDTEYQEDCLYDYVLLKTEAEEAGLRLCGSALPQEFASASNTAHLVFHSDYSVTGQGFFAQWDLVNISDCHQDLELSFPSPTRALTSVNFPLPYLNALDCLNRLAAPTGLRVGLSFESLDLALAEGAAGCKGGDHAVLYLDGLYGRRHRRFCGRHDTRGWSFLSYGPELSLAFRSDDVLRGNGYKALYSVVDPRNWTLFTHLGPNETLSLRSPNFPFPIPPDLTLRHRFKAPYGYRIRIHFTELHVEAELRPAQIYSAVVLGERREVDGDNDTEAVSLSPASLNLTTTTQWNKLQLLVTTGPVVGGSLERWRRYSAEVSVVLDADFWTNATVEEETAFLIESCDPEEAASERAERDSGQSSRPRRSGPCRNGGTCSPGPNGAVCSCPRTYQGAFCHLSQCYFKPCLNGGTCVLGSGQAAWGGEDGQTEESEREFLCHCPPGFTGPRCEAEIHPCASDPCAHGLCVERLGEFICNCPEGYKGRTCQIVDMFVAHTLRESFLRDPFWLGLFMVLGVISMVGLVHCWRKRASDTKGFFCGTESEEESAAEEAEKDPLLHASALSAHHNPRPSFGMTEENGELFFSLADFGIDVSTLPSLSRHGQDLEMKLKLSDLLQDQVTSLEEHLETILEVYEDWGSAAEPLRDSVKLSAALAGLTEVLLKSAEVLSPGERAERRSVAEEAEEAERRESLAERAKQRKESDGSRRAAQWMGAAVRALRSRRLDRLARQPPSAPAAPSTLELGLGGAVRRKSLSPSQPSTHKSLSSSCSGNSSSPSLAGSPAAHKNGSSYV